MFLLREFQCQINKIQHQNINTHATIRYPAGRGAGYSIKTVDVLMMYGQFHQQSARDHTGQRKEELGPKYQFNGSNTALSLIWLPFSLDFFGMKCLSQSGSDVMIYEAAWGVREEKLALKNFLTTG